MSLIILELKHVFKKTKIINIFALVALIIVTIFPKDFLTFFINGAKANEVVNILVPFISSLIIAIYILFMMVYVIFRVVSEYKEDRYKLFFISNRKHWQIVISKIIVNALIITVSLALVSIFSCGIIKFSTQNREFFSFDANYFDVIFGVLSASIVIYYVHVLTKSYKIFKENPLVKGIILIILINILTILVNTAVMLLCGGEIIVTSAPFGINISEDKLNSGLFNALTYVQDVLFMILLTYRIICLTIKKYELM